jgi:uncharacterized Zn finger protein (UPF0148 family)
MSNPTCLVCDEPIESYDGSEMCPGCEENDDWNAYSNTETSEEN